LDIKELGDACQWLAKLVGDRRRGEELREEER
jgi:hypothetical protein